jgi:lipopolysaccharide/colanic/teichoic acid biosynthesis glycosyltransferase
VDLEYVRRISAGLDLRILATTPAAILKRRGS